jgi:hypothetical protein
MLSTPPNILIALDLIILIFGHVTPLEDKLCAYRHKWFEHVHRMEDNRLPKQLLNYHPKGRRPLKRLLDDMTAETETGRPGLNS